MVELAVRNQVERMPKKNPSSDQPPNPAESSNIMHYLKNLATRARERRTRIVQTNLNSKQLSDPTHQTTLPFPFVGAPPLERFKLTSDSHWNYQGREKFEELLENARHQWSLAQWNHGLWKVSSSSRPCLLPDF
jgi:hypothetical protein